MLPCARSTSPSTTHTATDALAADELVAEMEHLVGKESWGVRDLLRGRVHADPGVLLDRVIACCLELLDDRMRLTPVELLVTSRSPRRICIPTGGEFDERVRTTIRWQLGLQPRGVVPVDPV